MRRLYAITLLLLACLGVSAQVDYRFIPLQSDMLPTDEVSSLIQDNEGYIWIVSYSGIARYDAYNISPLTPRSGLNEYFDGYLHTACDYDDEFMYVGSERGLLSLNKLTGEITKIKDAGLEYLNVNDIVHAHNGMLWVCGDKGIYRKPSKNDPFVKIDLKDEHGPITDVIDMVFDHNGDLWLTSWNKGLYKYDYSHSKLSCYSDGELGSAYVLYLDNKDNLWIGTWGKGLLKMNHDGSLSKYAYSQGDPNSLLDNIIYTINEDSEGKLWIGSRSGLSIFDGNGKFSNILPGSDIDCLPFNEVDAILRTRDGSMWLGMMGGGVCKAEPKYRDIQSINLDLVKQKYNTTSVRSIYPGGKNIFWMGLMGHGMIRYDNGNFVNYSEIPEFAELPQSSTFDAIIKRSSTGEICFGGYDNGLLLYNEQSGEVKAINSSSSRLGDDCIRALTEDTLGNIWIGTRGGVFVMDTSNMVHPLGEWLGTEAEITSFKILDMDCDKGGNVWMASNYDGIIKIDTKGRSISYYTIKSDPDEMGFNSIFVDSQNCVWAGSMWNGVYVYDASKDEFARQKYFTFLENKAVNNIAEGPEGRMWLSSGNSVISFRMVDGGYDDFWYKNISSSGESVFFNKNTSLYLPEEQQMAFGSSRGVLLFNTTPATNTKSAGKVIITSINANGRNIEKNDGTVVLKHSEGNNLSIGFSLLDFEDPTGDIYRYRLLKKGIGGSSNYMIVNGDVHSANFHNLSPGSYIFEVSGARSAGSEVSPLSTLKIRIKHNPWLAWWMILLYILAIGAATFFTMRYYLRKKRTLVVEMKGIDYTSDDKNFVQRAIDVVNNHLSDDNFYLEDFCREMAMSRTSLTNKLKELTGYTPTGFILNARLSTAYKIISEGKEKMRVSDLAYAVGFSDAKYFSKKFKARYGKTPKELMKE